LVNTFNLDWPDFVVEYNDTTKRVERDGGGQILSLECLLNDSSGDYVYKKLILVCFLPILILLLSTVFWAVIGRIKKQTHYFLSVINTSHILILFFIFYTLIIKTILVFFHCEDIDGTKYLSIAMDQECWEGDHLLVALAVATPGTIIYGFGLPILGVA
jgi:hypothetical protein